MAISSNLPRPHWNPRRAKPSLRGCATMASSPRAPIHMTTLYPLLFESIFKERVWGGRNLERLYRKPLPAGLTVGESWEITDRPEGVSVVANGPLAGKDLRWLMENHRQELLGLHAQPGPRFPLLIKLLDAQEKLSVQ